MATGPNPVPFVAPGKVAASQVIQFLEDGSMPPGDRPRPTDEEVNGLFNEATVATRLLDHVAAIRHCASSKPAAWYWRDSPASMSSWASRHLSGSTWSTLFGAAVAVSPAQVDAGLGLDRQARRGQQIQRPALRLKLGELRPATRHDQH